MQILRILRLFVIAWGFPLLAIGAGQPDYVVGQYHFSGPANLVGKAGAATADKVFALRTTAQFEGLVLDRLSFNLAESFSSRRNGNGAVALQPLLEDILHHESMASFGGPADAPLEFVFAIHLDRNQAAAWPQALEKAFERKAEPFRAENISGWQWNKGAKNSLWLVLDRDWVVTGRGEGLASVRSEYLREIQKSGRPGAALNGNWLEADVDWARLAHWLPLSSLPFKLGRTQIAIGTSARDFRMKGRIIYPETIPWQSHSWQIPTSMVREPLVSFTTGQDVGAFVNLDATLSRLGNTPLTDQFYLWSMAEMPFEDYAAWPVNNPAQTLRNSFSQAPAWLNPRLTDLNESELRWEPRLPGLTWSKIPIIAPTLQPASPAAGSFLLGGLFPLTSGRKPAPAGLWEQFKNHSDLVYYDWELTGPRLQQLRLLAEVLPILQSWNVGPDARGKAIDPKNPHSRMTIPRADLARLAIEDGWFASLTPLLGNTVTQVTRTAPNELSVIRASPFVFTGFELLLLSHWLTHTPPGPIEWGLLPQAKITGPGLPR